MNELARFVWLIPPRCYRVDFDSQYEGYRSIGKNSILKVCVSVCVCVCVCVCVYGREGDGVISHLFIMVLIIRKPTSRGCVSIYFASQSAY